MTVDVGLALLVVIPGVAVAVLLALLFVAKSGVDKQPAEWKEIMQLVMEQGRDMSRVNLRIVDLEYSLAQRDKGIAALLDQLEKLGVTPVWRPNGHAKQLKIGKSPLLILYDRMSEKFDEDDIDDLMFRLSIDSGDVGGATKGERLRNLLEHVVRRDRLESLLSLVAQLRPSVTDWPSLEDFT